MQLLKNRALALVAVLAIAGCSGSTGSQGPAGSNGKDGSDGAQGPKGDTGAAGQNGVSTGEVKGVLTYKPGSTSYPATNVTVSTVPNVGITATSGADGGYDLQNLPIGIYTIVFSGNGFTTAQVANVSVVSGGKVGLDQTLAASNPLVVTTAASTAAGFNKAVTMNVNVSGGTTPYTYKWTASASNPTAVTLSATNAATAGFTTGKVADVVAGCKAVGFGPTGTDYNTNAPGPGLAPAAGKCPVPATALRPGGEFVGVTSIQVSQMTYNFVVTVTDAQGFSKQLTVAVPTATLAAANGSVPVNATVIAYFQGNSGATLTGPQGSTAQLNDAATDYPWFVPDVAGTYTVKSGTKTLTVSAASYNSASPTCGGCHQIQALVDAGVAANFAEKFKEWTNSAHKNHFFKYYQAASNDPNDLTLVPKPASDAIWGMNLTNGTSQYGMLPTADPNVFWKTSDVTAPIPLIQFGLEGGEGNHYSSSCFPCHTTGYNPLATNNGFDDVAKAAGYSQGPLNFTLVGTNTATTGPQTQYWDAMPQSVKAFTGMQCESCHGPLGLHVTSGATPPVAEYSVAVCAVCHDAPSHHDKVWLWRQSGHANSSVAIAEGSGGSGSCNRCHTAQGYVLWLTKQQAGNPAGLTSSDIASLGLTTGNIQPQTCQACHDPHTTELRVSGDTNLLPAGFGVTGAGSGALCMTCHNSRNGARSDAICNLTSCVLNSYSSSAPSSIGAPHEANQTDVYAGQNAFFVTVAKPSGHMAVADTCVGCHMKQNPDGLSTANTNHTFAINTTVCSHCHGTDVDGEAIASQFETKYAALGSLLQTKALAALGTADFYVKGTGANAQSVLIAQSNISSITWVTGRSVGFVVQLKTAVKNPDDSTKADVTVLGTPTGEVAGYSLLNFYSDAGATQHMFVKAGVISKANWNYTLVDDGSKSFHNPNFVFNVMQATTDALNSSASVW